MAMTWAAVDDIDRTVKILVDTGKAGSIDEALGMVRSFVLQVDVGPDVADDAAAQAALLTIVNTGARAFLGGVRVRLATDPKLCGGWGDGLTASSAVSRYGGQIVDHLVEDNPTIAIGTTTSGIGKPLVHLTWRGWAGGVVRCGDRVLQGPAGNELAGVAAAALAVSEMFQHKTGNVLAGRRDVGLSLWRPDLDWTHTDAIGPALAYLPAALWLLGLGHLGQAYAWTLGALPHATPNDVQIGLVDFDVVVRGNTATQMLVTSGDIGRRKTRVVAAALEHRGFSTRLIERAFDERFQPVSHGDPHRDEPRIALAGFDDIEPRRQLGQHRFDRVIDAGLGDGAEYLDMVVLTFPAAGDPAAVFAAAPSRNERQLRPAYQTEIEQQVAAGQDEAAARCGMVDVAGITVGAAFVGAVASTIVIGDLLRLLHEDGTNYSVASLDLRAPHGVRAVPSSSDVVVAPPFTTVRA
jgi:hypothetical protein